MKKIILFILIILTFTGCSLEKKEINYLKENWQLDSTLKPTFAFEKSNKTDSYGTFYVDSQITFESFISYIKSLEANKFSINWKYSDVSTIEEFEKSYSEQTKENNIFKDGYVNIKMCNTEVCFFMQWVNKETYNTLNKDKPTSYSFKLETEKINQASKQN